HTTEAEHLATLNAITGHARTAIRHYGIFHTHSHFPNLKNALTLHWKHLAKDPGVLFTFEPKHARKWQDACAHYLGSHQYLLPPEQALLTMAGAHEKPDLFAEILLDVSTDDDLVKN